MIDDFINRKHGKTKVSYEGPATAGNPGRNVRRILYQEQVFLRIANKLA